MTTTTGFWIRGKAAFFVALLGLLALLALLGLLALRMSDNSVMANEPLWSDQERLEHRDIVCLGTVVSTEKVGPVDEHADLHLAVVEITSTRKGDKITAGSKINVYYESSESGQNKRCPACAKLAKGEKATFYLRHMSEPIQARLKIKTAKEPALFLEMGSDVQKIVEILKVIGPRDASIGVGSADGAAVGNVFSVFRDQAPLGRLKLTEVNRDQSNGTVITLQGGSKLEPGDVVVRDGTFQFLGGLRPDSAIKEPAKEGRMYANADIRRGLTRVLYYGPPWSQGKPFIDDDTKYPVMIADGCVVGKDFRSFVGEYNRAMKEHFQKTAKRSKGSGLFDGGFSFDRGFSYETTTPDPFVLFTLLHWGGLCLLASAVTGVVLKTVLPAKNQAEQLGQGIALTLISVVGIVLTILHFVRRGRGTKKKTDKPRKAVGSSKRKPN